MQYFAHVLYLWQNQAQLASRLDDFFVNKPFRKPTNLYIDIELLEEAKAMDVNLSRAAESSIGIERRLTAPPLPYH